MDLWLFFFLNAVTRKSTILNFACFSKKVEIDHVWLIDIFLIMCVGILRLSKKRKYLFALQLLASCFKVIGTRKQTWKRKK